MHPILPIKFRRVARSPQDSILRVSVEMLYMFSGVTKPFSRVITSRHSCIVSYGIDVSLPFSSLAARAVTFTNCGPNGSLQWTRTNYNRPPIRRYPVKDFAYAFPRQHKLYDMERRKDELSKEWDLIFTTSPSSRFFTAIHWVLVCGVVCGLPFIVKEYFEREGEGNVLILYQEVGAQSEMLILGSIFLAFHFLVYHVLRRFPKSIYYNESKDCYKVVLRTFFPFRTKKMDFLATDVIHNPGKVLPFLKDSIFSLSHERFTISSIKKTLILPSFYFRTGDDAANLLWSSKFSE